MTQNQVILGDVLQLFTTHKDGNDQMTVSIGGATNHTLTVSPEYIDIACKDAGTYGWKKLNKITWEIQTENLYVPNEYRALLENLLNDYEFTVYFGTSNWNVNGIQTQGEAWEPADFGSSSEPICVSQPEAQFICTPGDSSANMLYSGKVKVSSLTLNAQTGETASYSCTLTGVGPMQMMAQPPV